MTKQKTITNNQIFSFLLKLEQKIDWIAQKQLQLEDQQRTLSTIILTQKVKQKKQKKKKREGKKKETRYIITPKPIEK